LEAMAVSRLADHECVKHGRLPGDRTKPCGCFGDESSYQRREAAA
jgi:hypothetical protein